MTNERVHPIAQQVLACFAPTLVPTIDFTCDQCGKVFGIPTRDYRGQFDHEPAVPLCEDCNCPRCLGTGYRRDWRGHRVRCDECGDGDQP